MSKTTKNPMPPPKRITVTVPPPIVRRLLDEHHERRMAGESVSLAQLMVERMERGYGEQKGDLP